MGNKMDRILFYLSHGLHGHGMPMGGGWREIGKIDFAYCPRSGAEDFQRLIVSGILFGGHAKRGQSLFEKQLASN
jgi:hypothetical protein